MNLNIAVIAGDGVGPEMMEAALLVLRRVCRRYGHQLRLEPVLASAEIICSPLHNKEYDKCMYTY